MSLYNSLFGVNSISKVLLAMLDLTIYDVGRFRDCYLDMDEKQIIVYTRNGGGNREDFQEVFDELSQNPYYVDDYDDDFDCTYAYIIFNIPEQYLDLCKDLWDEKPIETIGEKFKELFNKLNSKD